MSHHPARHHRRPQRRPLALAAAALAGMAGLSGCGGNPGAGIADAYTCAFTNCKSSTEVAAEDLRLGGNLTRENGRVTASFGLGYRANLLTVVRLQSPDGMLLLPGPVPLEPKSQEGGALGAQVQSSQDRWTVRLQHGGKSYDSSIELPPEVQIRVPAPSTLTRSLGQFGTTLNVAADPLPQVVLGDGDCQLADGRSARWSGEKNGPAVRLNGAGAGQYEYGVSTEALQLSLNEAAASALSATSSAGIVVKQCRVSLVWAVTRNGTVASALSSYGSVRGTSQVRQSLSYVNDR